jgi:NAD(P)-dependent dehydrogenase (short-subunit alcohol dehydrogenase family)
LNIDHLILNAGAYHIPRHKCNTSYDNVFQINFVSPYYIAKALTPHISARGGKIVAVGSIAHNYSHTDENDTDFSTRKKASLVYGNAKRYLMYSLLQSDTRCITVTHPGITFTNITAHYPKLIFALIKHPMKVIFMRPRKAALCILAGLFADVPKDSWIGPRLFNVWGYPRIKRLLSATEQEKSYIKLTADNIFDNL